MVTMTMEAKPIVTIIMEHRETNKNRVTPREAQRECDTKEKITFKDSPLFKMLDDLLKASDINLIDKSYY